eukprot:4212908-Alexandrium_andersonii.AAC.1
MSSSTFLTSRSAGTLQDESAERRHRHGTYSTGRLHHRTAGTACVAGPLWATSLGGGIAEARTAQ